MLFEFHALAKSIIRNSKGEVLLTALRRGFAAAEKAQKTQGAPALQQKALVFTESRRTQEYLYEILQKTEFAGKIVLFNGSNSDPKSKEIYRAWLERHTGTDLITNSPTADKRAALVDYFRDEAAIMIATEAAAEGINLQFCNLVVNYDLPWNPQRIEQRIGRCHRYGQRFDVVVVNFLNKTNAADQRVYQLLDEKFRLFNGVFGASDEVLGAIESPSRQNEARIPLASSTNRQMPFARCICRGVRQSGSSRVGLATMMLAQRPRDVATFRRLGE